MSDAARVSSVEAVERFYRAVRVFQGEAENALLALDQQVSKVLAWYDYDAPHYWKEQVRRSYDEVARARTAYDTCRMRTVADHRPSCYEEKEALAAAKGRQEYAREKIEAVGRWSVRLHRVIDEFRAQSGRLKLYLDSDVEKTAALLERTLASLESYLGHGINAEEPAGSASAPEPEAAEQPKPKPKEKSED